MTLAPGTKLIVMVKAISNGRKREYPSRTRTRQIQDKTEPTKIGQENKDI